MERSEVNINEVPNSPLVEVDGIIYVSGQVGRGVDQEASLTDVGAQTTRALERIESVLESVGSSRRDIVKTSVFLVNVKRDFEAMNEAYAEFFAANYPARTTVGADLAVDFLVEIDAVAVRGRAAN